MFALLTQKFELKNVLILGAYRSTEVTDIHPLTPALQSLKTIPSQFVELNLKPLTLQNLQHYLQHWLSDSFYLIGR
ncbi:hypothetical protein [Candidatus Coxiella mudrowiae]|uniref:hypothetical protein n=1 Tax=Candidatus Coxiella mudrowiae TaxID=2054173 RepID=UPI001F35ED57|nr:hypothetical protein [Candidatus Coxiella mudrowiae]